MVGAARDMARASGPVYLVHDRLEIQADGTSRSIVASTTLGAALDADITVQDEQAAVSRHHCRLKVDGWSLVLEDLGSTNGTWVNAEGGWQRLTGPRSVQVGDRFVLGTVEATVHPPI